MSLELIGAEATFPSYVKFTFNGNHKVYIIMMSSIVVGISCWGSEVLLRGRPTFAACVIHRHLTNQEITVAIERLPGRSSSRVGICKHSGQTSINIVSVRKGTSHVLWGLRQTVSISLIRNSLREWRHLYI